MKPDPKSLEFTIKVSILAYPSLYECREQVLNHYYCVLGNGYDWWDGRLIERCDDEKIQAVEKMLLKGVPRRKIKAWVKKKDDDRLSRALEKIEKKLKKLGMSLPTSGRSPETLKIYPVCEFCAIMKLPDDIRPDWLSGAEEAVKLMETWNSYDERGTKANRSLIPEIRERIAVLKARNLDDKKLSKAL